MEALAAVALAGNVLQFVEFVGRLFKDASKIYASASGLTSDDLHIQDICSKFDTFSAQLEVTPSDPHAPLDKDLQACVAACKKDCDGLLSIVRMLATKKGKTRKCWKSFSAALSHKLKVGEIEGLKSRVQDHQNLISLQLSKMLNQRVRVMSNEVSQLQSTITDWTIRTAAWFDRLLDTHKSLGQQIETLSQQMKTPNRQENTPQGAIESICSGLRGLSLDTQDYRQTMNILRSLDYEERPKRHSNIPEAHQTTFAWGVQQDNMGESQGSGSFRRWLSGHSNLFWVSGKPGSGKSTFIKFVADNEKTEECLRQWAGHGQLVLAKHFFTIYGTTIQRSLEGLLRSLLHNILDGEPKLMQKLLPTRWTSKSVQSHWTHSELESTMRAVANMDLSVHMCFFIDGLDEYAGDHLEICQTLEELSKSPFIKVCVSSRPWNVFEDAFGSPRESKLYMHELTHGDILRYTQVRLQEHPQWGFFSSGSNAAASQSLINEVVDKSMGVFLWVFLVTDLLREGLSNGDSFSDLKRRVSSYPNDLEEFFKHILDSVDPFYHEKMAGTLMIARDAGKPLATEMFMFHDHEYDDEDYALHDPTYDETLDFADCEQKSSLVPRRINGRCKGLLEWQNGRMVFLHRTVFDFLQTDEMAKFLREKAKANFCSYLSLLRARLAWFKRTAFTQEPPLTTYPDLMNNVPDLIEKAPGFAHSLREAARYARLASDEGGNTEVAVAALLDNAELGIGKMVRTFQIQVASESTAVGVYRLLLLERGIDGYLDNKLSMPGYLDNPYTDRHHSPLSFVLKMVPISPPSTSSIDTKINPRLLETLLKCGHDPNKAYGDDTFWTRFVEFYTCELCTLSRREMPGIALETGTLEMLLRHGADPTALIPLSLKGKYKVPFWLHLLLTVRYISLRHRPAFERIWDLTLDRVPALSHAQFRKKVCSWVKGREQEKRTSHSLWDAMPYGIPAQELLEQSRPQDDTFLLRLLAKVLDGLRDNLTAFEQCLGWFAQCLCFDPHQLMQRLPCRLQEINFKRRLVEEDEEGGSRVIKARRLV